MFDDLLVIGTAAENEDTGEDGDKRKDVGR